MTQEEALPVKEILLRAAAPASCSRSCLRNLWIKILHLIHSN